jgi:hypothetical protein
MTYTTGILPYNLHYRYQKYILGKYVQQATILLIKNVKIALPVTLF